MYINRYDATELKYQFLFESVFFYDLQSTSQKDFVDTTNRL